MNKLLAIVTSIYGEAACRRVFEPLVADAENEMRGSSSRLLRLRWQAAFAVAMLKSLPRATFAGLPAALVLDLATRAVVFAALGLALQWFFGAAIGFRSAAGWPPSFSSTLPFLIIPVAWRVRVATISHQQRRLLVVTLAAACVAATTTLSGGDWGVRTAFASGVVWLTWCGWRMGDPAFVTSYPRNAQWWWRAFCSGSMIMVSGWPIKFALGVSLTASFWPADQLMMVWVAGPLIALCMNVRSVSRTEVR